MEEVDQELDSVRELLNSEYDEIQAKVCLTWHLSG